MTMTAYQIGFAFGFGVVAAALCVAAMVTFLGWMLGVISPTDQTDAGPSNRSGFDLRTDHGTGLQYPVARGGITPRLDADGKHMRAGDPQ